MGLTPKGPRPLPSPSPFILGAPQVRHVSCGTRLLSSRHMAKCALHALRDLIAAPLFSIFSTETCDPGGLSRASVTTLFRNPRRKVLQCQFREAASAVRSSMKSMSWQAQSGFAIATLAGRPMRLPLLRPLAFGGRVFAGSRAVNLSKATNRHRERHVISAANADPTLLPCEPSTTNIFCVLLHSMAIPRFVQWWTSGQHMMSLG